LTKSVLLLLLLLAGPRAHAVESCGRTAVVNYQEVLVDASSSNRGEGLRYYLQKDPVSKKLLDDYQDNNRPRWQTAALSTAGTALVVASLLRGGGDNDGLMGQKAMLVGGATMVAVGYLISRTKQYNNEERLERAVEEYNKRNSPRIFFSADPASRGRSGFGLGAQQEF
jgi:hypothetical protein